MGLPQITGGMYANNNKTELENFKSIGLSKTHSNDDLMIFNWFNNKAIYLFNVQT